MALWMIDVSNKQAASLQAREDALFVSKMSVNPGGRQRVTRDGFWKGKPLKMNFALGVPKGLQIVLTERGIHVDASKLNADKIREFLGNHPDFRDEMSMLK